MYCLNKLKPGHCFSWQFIFIINYIFLIKQFGIAIEKKQSNGKGAPFFLIVDQILERSHIPTGEITLFVNLTRPWSLNSLKHYTDYYTIRPTIVAPETASELEEQWKDDQVDRTGDTYGGGRIGLSRITAYSASSRLSVSNRSFKLWVQPVLHTAKHSPSIYNPPTFLVTLVNEDPKNPYWFWKPQLLLHAGGGVEASLLLTPGYLPPLTSDFKAYNDSSLAAGKDVYTALSFPVVNGARYHIELLPSTASHHYHRLRILPASRHDLERTIKAGRHVAMSHTEFNQLRFLYQQRLWLKGDDVVFNLPKESSSSSSIADQYDHNLTQHDADLTKESPYAFSFKTMKANQNQEGIKQQQKPFQADLTTIPQKLSRKQKLNYRQQQQQHIHQEEKASSDGAKFDVIKNDLFNNQSINKNVSNVSDKDYSISLLDLVEHAITSNRWEDVKILDKARQRAIYDELKWLYELHTTILSILFESHFEELIRFAFATLDITALRLLLVLAVRRIARSIAYLRYEMIDQLIKEAVPGLQSSSFAQECKSLSIPFINTTYLKIPLKKLLIRKAMSSIALAEIDFEKSILVYLMRWTLTQKKCMRFLNTFYTFSSWASLCSSGTKQTRYHHDTAAEALGINDTHKISKSYCIDDVSYLNHSTQLFDPAMVTKETLKWTIEHTGNVQEFLTTADEIIVSTSQIKYNLMFDKKSVHHKLSHLFYIMSLLSATTFPEHHLKIPIVSLIETRWKDTYTPFPSTLITDLDDIKTSSLNSKPTLWHKHLFTFPLWRYPKQNNRIKTPHEKLAQKWKPFIVNFADAFQQVTYKINKKCHKFLSWTFFHYNNTKHHNMGHIKKFDHPYVLVNMSFFPSYLENVFITYKHEMIEDFGNEFIKASMILHQQKLKNDPITDLFIEFNNTNQLKSSSFSSSKPISYLNQNLSPNVSVVTNFGVHNTSGFLNFLRHSTDKEEELFGFKRLYQEALTIAKNIHNTYKKEQHPRSWLVLHHSIQQSIAKITDILKHDSQIKFQIFQILEQLVSDLLRIRIHLKGGLLKKKKESYKNIPQWDIVTIENNDDGLLRRHVSFQLDIRDRHTYFFRQPMFHDGRYQPEIRHYGPTNASAYGLLHGRHFALYIR